MIRNPSFWLAPTPGPDYLDKLAKKIKSDCSVKGDQVSHSEIDSSDQGRLMLMKVFSLNVT